MSSIGGVKTESGNKIVVHLTITSGHDLNELSRRVQLPPSKTWRAGDPIDRSSRCHGRNGWRVSAPGQFNDIESGIDELLALLNSEWAALRGLGDDLQVEVTIVIYANEYAPALHLRSDQVRRLAELNADIDIDLYCLMGG